MRIFVARTLRKTIVIIVTIVTIVGYHGITENFRIFNVHVRPSIKGEYRTLSTRSAARSSRRKILIDSKSSDLSLIQHVRECLR